ncbi:MAG: hypothetical protein H7289_12185 [Mucilaginibacter sp.]|nr:hypothetical protein [Mucilaginibacter sp.]
MNTLVIEKDLQLLYALVTFLRSENYNASVFNGDSVVIKDVTNKGNNFRIIKTDGYYVVYTICISKDDYEYTAKCTVYVLLAEYNKSNGTSTHLHINFKVDL